jgi:hypothetical protein
MSTIGIGVTVRTIPATVPVGTVPASIPTTVPATIPIRTIPTAVPVGTIPGVIPAIPTVIPIWRIVGNNPRVVPVEVVETTHPTRICILLFHLTTYRVTNVFVWTLAVIFVNVTIAPRIISGSIVKYFVRALHLFRTLLGREIQVVLCHHR